METITLNQYNTLLNGTIPSDLPDYIKDDITYVKTILLCQYENEFFVEYIELNELTDEEITETKQRGTMVTISFDDTEAQL